MSWFNNIFYEHYLHAYPQDFHLKDQLRYYVVKHRMTKELLEYIQRTWKKILTICDVWAGYGYDDTLFKKVVRHYYPDVEIQVDIFDPELNFYKETTHTKQEGISYYEQSFLTIDIPTYTNHYDVIICSEVVEHLRTSEQEVFFTNFNHILKIGGMILLTTPNGSSIFKTIAGLLQRKKHQKDLFEAEFNHRYAHIGVAPLFQLMGLFVRKWFELQKIYPATRLSSTRFSQINIVLNTLFRICVWVNLFFSTDILWIAEKKGWMDTTKRYNTFSL